MKNKVLPIGTVVRLMGGKHSVMITGYNAIDRSNPNNKFDYNGCIFPEGLMKNLYTLFDHGQIEEILCLGYKDEDFEEFVKDKFDDDTSSSSLVDGGSTKVNSSLTKDEMKSKYGKNKEIRISEGWRL